MPSSAGSKGAGVAAAAASQLRSEGQLLRQWCDAKRRHPAQLHPPCPLARLSKPGLQQHPGGPAATSTTAAVATAVGGNGSSSAAVGGQQQGLCAVQAEELTER
jgi:hypothetical protein